MIAFIGLYWINLACNKPTCHDLEGNARVLVEMISKFKVHGKSFATVIWRHSCPFFC